MSKPLILVVNDDGITAPGIRALVEAVRPLGEVIVVAPDSPQSGMGHAITINKPLRLTKAHVFDEASINATPAIKTNLVAIFLIPNPLIYFEN